MMQAGEAALEEIFTRATDPMDASTCHQLRRRRYTTEYMTVFRLSVIIKLKE